MDEFTWRQSNLLAQLGKALQWSNDQRHHLNEVELIDCTLAHLLEQVGNLDPRETLDTAMQQLLPLLEAVRQQLRTEEHKTQGYSFN